ncbi:hypothetical protein [Rhizobium phaseoli]|nr:hypothetical protein [Rhizobium phaseoli]
MEIFRRVAANKAAIAAYEETRRIANKYTPPLRVSVGCHLKGWGTKLENQKALYEAAARAEAGQTLRISELGIFFYQVKAEDCEALRNPEKQRAAALKIKGELDAIRAPSKVQSVGRR